MRKRAPVLYSAKTGRYKILFLSRVSVSRRATLTGVKYKYGRQKRQNVRPDQESRCLGEPRAPHCPTVDPCVARVTIRDTQKEKVVPDPSHRAMEKVAHSNSHSSVVWAVHTHAYDSTDAARPGQGRPPPGI